MRPKRFDEELIEAFKELTPQFGREFIERGRQIDQVVMWLVGISSAVIALLVSNIDKLQLYYMSGIKISLLLFGATVVLGVVRRVFHYAAEGLEAQQLRDFRNYLEAASKEFIGPIDLPENSTPQLIADCLKRHMGLDYDFLLPYEKSVDKWMEIYNKAKVSWEKQEEEGKSEFIRVYCKIFGGDEMIFKSRLEDEQFSSNPRLAGYLRTISNWLYLLTSLAFVMGVVVMSWVLMKSL